jgi:PAS domain S-box-containing protein
MVSRTEIKIGKSVKSGKTKTPSSLTRLGELINKIWFSVTEEELEAIIAEYARPVFGADGSGVFVLDENGTLSGPYVTSEPEPTATPLTVPLDSDNIISRAFAAGEPLNIPALNERLIAGLEPLTGSLGAPALAAPFGADKPEGVLLLLRRPDNGDFSPADTKEARLVTDALEGAIALIGARLEAAGSYFNLPAPGDAVVSDIPAAGPEPGIFTAPIRERQIRADDLRVINEVGWKLLTVVDTKEVLELLITSIREIFDYYNVSIYLFDEREPDKLVLGAIAGGYSDVLPPNHAIKTSKSIVGHAASTGDYVVANDAYNDPRHAPDVIDIPEKSQCALPIMSEGSVIGVLDVQHDRKNAFNDRALRLLLAMTDQAALALRKAKLFEQQEGATKEANILLRISSGLGQSTETGKPLEYLAEETVSALGADATAIILVNEDYGAGNVLATAGLPDDTKEALLSSEIPIAPGLIGSLEKAPRAIAIEDVSASDVKSIRETANIGAKSILLSPIKTKGRLAGIIVALWTTEKKVFGEKDINLAAGIAVQTGVALENALYFENLTRQTHFLSVIGTIAGEASRLPPVDELMENALFLLLKYTGLNSGVIFLYDDEHVRRHTFLSSGLPEAAESSVVASLRDDRTPWEGAPEISIVNEISENDTLIAAFPPDERPAAYLNIPLLAKKAYTGHIYLFSEKLLTFDRNQINSIQTICKQLSTFIETSLIFRQNVEQLEQMRTLLETSKQISSSLDPEEIIYNIAQEVKNLINADECTVFLLNREGGYLEPIVSLTAYPEEMLKVRLKVGEGITGNVALTGTGEYINDPLSDPRSKHVEGTPETETESILCVPLVSKEDVIGVMTLHRLATNPFTDRDLELVTLFATQVAGLIENARMFDRVLSSMTVAEEQRRKLDAIFASVSEAFIVTDSNLKVIEINEAAEEFLGTAQEKVVNRYINSVIDDEEIIGRLEEALINPPGEKPAEFTHIKTVPETESEEYYRFTIDHLKDAEANIIGLVISFIEITDQVALERMKDHFIANVSHELRTPLTSIIGSTELMLDDKSATEPPFNRFINIINKEAVRLRNLVDSILDFSLLEAGKFDLELEPTSIKDVCEEIIYRYNNMAEDYGVTLDYSPTEEIGVVAVDQRLLDSILSNLVKNSIYFNKRGGTVELVTYKDETDDRYLVIKVSDTGKGMTDEQIEKMFSKFYQADASSSRAVGGMGIGLSIVKKGVEAHGGHLEVTSELGVGSVFTIYLPLITP